MNSTTMTREDTKIERRAPSAPHFSRASNSEKLIARDGREAPRVTAQGRRLRMLLILGNIVVWALIILAVRVVFL
ncbi:MAG TPA: hypothetical protein VGG01_27120 [Xanthobacteraceae bacterium]|jgi:hypothetical protein